MDVIHLQNIGVFVSDGWGGGVNSDLRMGELRRGYSCLIGGRLRVSRALW